MQTRIKKKLRTVEWDNTSGFKVGDKVYVVCRPGHIEETKINAWEAGVIEEKDKEPIIIIKKARLDIILIDDYFIDQKIGTEFVHFKYLYKTKKEAEKEAKFYPVKNISDKMWYEAIGDRDNDIEECELSSCCSNISDTRDLLIKCKKNKGLVGLEADWIKCLLESSGHADVGKRPVLKKIFKQLCIKF